MQLFFENEFVTNLLLVFPVQHKINKDQISNVIHFHIFQSTFLKVVLLKFFLFNFFFICDVEK